MMTNLTISVPEDVVYRARTRAAREGTSVSKILRATLMEYGDDSTVVGQAWDDFLAIADQHSGRSTGPRWTRDELQRGATR